MFKRKLQLVVTTVFIFSFVLAGCSSSNPTISSKDVKSVNMVGGMPLSKYKSLSSPKDLPAINKIVTMVNSAKKTNLNKKDYYYGKGIGYPLGIEIKLQNGAIWSIEPLFQISTKASENGTNPRYRDRVELDIESHGKSSSYTLFSEELANYVLKGAVQDMPWLPSENN